MRGGFEPHPCAGLLPPQGRLRLLVIKGELRRPMPSALPVRSVSHARSAVHALALRAHLSLLPCRAGRIW